MKHAQEKGEGVEFLSASVPTSSVHLPVGGKYRSQCARDCPMQTPSKSRDKCLFAWGEEGQLTFAISASLTGGRCLCRRACGAKHLFQPTPTASCLQKANHTRFWRKKPAKPADRNLVESLGVHRVLLKQSLFFQDTFLAVVSSSRLYLRERLIPNV